MVSAMDFTLQDAVSVSRSHSSSSATDYGRYPPMALPGMAQKAKEALKLDTTSAQPTHPTRPSQTTTGTSLYPPSTSSDERSHSPPSPVSLLTPIGPPSPGMAHHAATLIENTDDVAFRLQLLVKNNYFLPPAHIKPNLSPVPNLHPCNNNSTPHPIPKVEREKSSPRIGLNIFRKAKKAQSLEFNQYDAQTSPSARAPLVTGGSRFDQSTGDKRPHTSHGTGTQGGLTFAQAQQQQLQESRRPSTSRAQTPPQIPKPQVHVLREPLPDIRQAYLASEIKRQQQQPTRHAHSSTSPLESRFNTSFDPMDDVDGEFGVANLAHRPSNLSAGRMMNGLLGDVSGMTGMGGEGSSLWRSDDGGPSSASMDYNERWRRALLEEAVGLSLSNSLNTTPTPSPVVSPNVSTSHSSAGVPAPPRPSPLGTGSASPSPWAKSGTSERDYRASTSSSREHGSRSASPLIFNTSIISNGSRADADESPEDSFHTASSHHTPRPRPRPPNSLRLSTKRSLGQHFLRASASSAELRDLESGVLHHDERQDYHNFESDLDFERATMVALPLSGASSVFSSGMRRSAESGRSGNGSGRSVVARTPTHADVEEDADEPEPSTASYFTASPHLQDISGRDLEEEHREDDDDAHSSHYPFPPSPNLSFQHPSTPPPPQPQRDSLLLDVVPLRPAPSKRGLSGLGMMTTYSGGQTGLPVAKFGRGLVLDDEEPRHHGDSGELRESGSMSSASVYSNPFIAHSISHVPSLRSPLSQEFAIQRPNANFSVSDFGGGEKRDSVREYGSFSLDTSRPDASLSFSEFGGGSGSGGRGNGGDGSFSHEVSRPDISLSVSEFGDHEFDIDHHDQEFGEDERHHLGMSSSSLRPHAEYQRSSFDTTFGGRSGANGSERGGASQRESMASSRMRKDSNMTASSKASGRYLAVPLPTPIPTVVAKPQAQPQGSVSFFDQVEASGLRARSLSQTTMNADTPGAFEFDYRDEELDDGDDSEGTEEGIERALRGDRETLTLGMGRMGLHDPSMHMKQHMIPPLPSPRSPILDSFLAQQQSQARVRHNEEDSPPSPISVDMPHSIRNQRAAEDYEQVLAPPSPYHERNPDSQLNRSTASLNSSTTSHTTSTNSHSNSSSTQHQMSRPPIGNVPLTPVSGARKSFFRRKGKEKYKHAEIEKEKFAGIGNVSVKGKGKSKGKEVQESSMEVDQEYSSSSAKLVAPHFAHRSTSASDSSATTRLYALGPRGNHSASHMDVGPSAFMLNRDDGGSRARSGSVPVSPTTMTNSNWDGMVAHHIEAERERMRKISLGLGEGKGRR